MHLGTDASHHLVLLADSCYTCDCCMGINLGIPCCHYFQVLTKVQGMKFNIGLICPNVFFHSQPVSKNYQHMNRWYQNPSLNLSTVPLVGLEHCISTAQPTACLPPSSTLVCPLILNLLDKTVLQPPTWPTDTVPTQTIHHEAQAVMHQVTAHIQTCEQLDDFIMQVDAFG